MIMAVGFAMFSQQLQINSTSEVTSSWCLGFDSTLGTVTSDYTQLPTYQNGKNWFIKYELYPSGLIYKT